MSVGVESVDGSLKLSSLIRTYTNSPVHTASCVRPASFPGHAHLAESSVWRISGHGRLTDGTSDQMRHTE